MALLRLTTVALAACSAAAAAPGTPAAAGAADRAPGAPHAVPARWVALPPIAAAVTAAAPGATADAWGDPAQGCYAVWLAIPGAAGDAPALADQIVAGLTGLSPTELARPTGPGGELSFAFARPPYHGQVQARLGHGQITATACFGNQREPLACNAACARVLQDVP